MRRRKEIRFNHFAPLRSVFLFLFCARIYAKRQVQRAKANNTGKNEYCCKYQKYNGYCAENDAGKIQTCDYDSNYDSNYFVDCSHVLFHNFKNKV